MPDRVQLIKEEIERRLYQAKDFSERANGADDKASKLAWDFVATQYESLIQFIDSIPEEHNEDLEEEFNRFLDEVEGVPRMWHSDEQMEWGKDIARHFAKWQKQQMMKDAVEGYVSLCHDYPYRRSLVAIEDGLTKLEYAEKIRIIIVKENML